jgi:hypothetical protein
MEGLSRSSTDINWTVQGKIQWKPFTNIGVGIAVNTIENGIPECHCIFSAVCDWNLIMMSFDMPIPNQCYSIQAPLNT